MNAIPFARTLAVFALLVFATFAHAQSFDSEYVESTMRVQGGYGVDATGDVYFLSDRGADQTWLRRVTADGVVVWEVSFPGHVISSSRIVVSGARIAVATLMGDDANANSLTLVVRNFDRSNGNAFTPVTIASGLMDQDPVVGLRADGTINVIYLPNGSPALHRVTVPPVGVVSDVAVAGANTWFEDAYFTASGATLVAQSDDTSFAYVLLSPLGAITRSFTASQLGVQDHYAVLAPDGSVFVLGKQDIPAVGSRVVAIKLAANGTEAWRTTLRETTGEFGFPPVFGDGAVFFAITGGTDPATGEALPPISYHALEYATGASRWNIDVPVNRYGYFRNAVTSDGALLVGVRTLLSNKIRIQVRDTDTGAILSDREIGCGATSCSALETTLTDDDTLRIVSRINTPTPARNAIYDFAIERRAPTEFVDVAQRGVRGVYNVGSNGQGIVIDFDAASGTLFAPWFTMSYRAPTSSQTTTVADLHWYTIQATPVAGQSEVGVVIYETAGGTFATGAPIAPARVGEGTLSFDDCNHGTLAYSFDANHNGGAQGIVSLDRLIARTDGCTDEAGAFQPADTSHDGDGNLFLNYSGSWSQVGSSGQGLEFVIRPGEVIAGAWFTFDPATSNDEQHHHWFTLSGDLSNATGGIAEVTLYQTIGGTFDNREAPNPPTAVGTATIDFADCSTAEMTYAFNGDAGAFANTTGSIDLEHLGRCDDPSAQ